VKLPDFKAKYVYLTGNQISSLSARTLMPDIASDIIGLDVSFNDIEDIERGAFDKMTSLKKLRLNQNWINNLEWVLSKI
jgi:Leucine-rich repeat (LRR) protein